MTFLIDGLFLSRAKFSSWSVRFATLLCLAAIPCSIIPAQAQGVRWVITDEWEGRGEMTTRMFQVNGDKWRLIYRHKSNKAYRIEVFDDDHELVETAVSENAPFYSFIQLKKAGQFYLKIHGTKAKWEVQVKQFLTSGREWDLLQAVRNRRAALEPLASWHGTAGDKTIPVTAPSGSWKLVYTAINEEEGSLSLTIRPEKETAQFKPMTYTLQGEKAASTWVHQAGKFNLHIKAENTPWKVDLLYYPPPRTGAQK